MTGLPQQNTEDELEAKLSADGAFQHILKTAPQSQRELMTFELARYFTREIEQEKLQAQIELINDLADVGEIHHSVSDYRLDVLQAKLTELNGGAKDE